MMDMPMFGGWMLLLWLLFLAAIVVGVLFLVRALWGRSTGDGRAGRGPEALRILEERFARGEIDEREFEERRRLLRS